VYDGSPAGRFRGCRHRAARRAAWHPPALGRGAGMVCNRATSPVVREDRVMTGLAHPRRRPSARQPGRERRRTDRL